MLIRLSSEDLDAFWEKVDRTSSPNGCWGWTGGVTGGRRGGYGATSITLGDRKYQITTHRLMMHIQGVDPTGRVVRHRCHNRRCCNPQHLLLGEHWDNMQDMKQAGRAARLYGELNGQAALLDCEAVAILNTPQVRDCEVARRFATSERTIRRLRRGDTYRHLHEKC